MMMIRNLERRINQKLFLFWQNEFYLFTRIKGKKEKKAYYKGHYNNDNDDDGSKK